MRGTKTKVKELLKREDITPMQKDVIKDILSRNAKETYSYMNDVLQHGCVSGVASSMIYYKDTYKFFKKHFEEILDLAKEDGFISGYNNMAWYGYESTVRWIMDEIGVL